MSSLSDGPTPDYLECERGHGLDVVSRSEPVACGCGGHVVFGCRCGAALAATVEREDPVDAGVMHMLGRLYWERCGCSGGHQVGA